MKFVNIREFRSRLSELIESEEEIIITRYGKPVSKLAPIRPVTYADLAREMGKAFDEAGVSRKDALAALDAVRAEPTHRRSGRGSRMRSGSRNRGGIRVATAVATRSP